MINNNYKHEPIVLTIIMTVIINNNNYFLTHRFVECSLASWSCTCAKIIIRIIKARGDQREPTIIQNTIRGD